MELASPVRSAYATVAVARILSDVLDTNGQVVVPAGSTAYVPLNAPDGNGRFESDSAGGWITLTGGQTISLDDRVLIVNGGNGLVGKLLKRGRLGKFLRGLAEAGATVGTQYETTREAAQALEGVISRSVEGSNQGRAVIEVKAGTRFRVLVR